jgi:hypothetical protein
MNTLKRKGLRLETTAIIIIIAAIIKFSYLFLRANLTATKTSYRISRQRKKK